MGEDIVEVVEPFASRDVVGVEDPDILQVQRGNVSHRPIASKGENVVCPSGVAKDFFRNRDIGAEDSCPIQSYFV